MLPDALGAGRAGDAGYRLVPHTADLRIESWAASREECLAQAVRGLVASFADVSDARPAREAAEHLTAAAGEDLLAAALEEVIYHLDADGEVPASVTVRRAADGGVDLALGLAALGSVTITGAGPKAVSLHEIRCSADLPGRWSASVTVDV